MTAATALRWVTGGAGVASIGLGVWLVAAGSAPFGVLTWLIGALVLHDGIIAPLVLACGLLIAGLRQRGLWRGALVVAGCATLVTLPALLRPGQPLTSSALPLPYGRNLLLVVAAVAAATGAVARVRWRKAQARQRYARARPKRTASRRRP
ncbi:hypothetical protein ACFVWY_32330 [Streptomyces sp. NPDC058195]|uniref:hypothetical protein n=1 Tax=Streptomyces sp. NPDC058195 TaxID=3346375 RepID=UPI0036E6509C